MNNFVRLDESHLYNIIKLWQNSNNRIKSALHIHHSEDTPPCCLSLSTLSFGLERTSLLQPLSRVLNPELSWVLPDICAGGQESHWWGLMASSLLWLISLIIGLFCQAQYICIVGFTSRELFSYLARLPAHSGRRLSQERNIMFLKSEITCVMWSLHLGPVLPSWVVIQIHTAERVTSHKKLSFSSLKITSLRLCFAKLHQGVISGCTFWYKIMLLRKMLVNLISSQRS